MLEKQNHTHTYSDHQEIHVENSELGGLVSHKHQKWGLRGTGLSLEGSDQSWEEVRLL